MNDLHQYRREWALSFAWRKKAPTPSFLAPKLMLLILFRLLKSPNCSQQDASMKKLAIVMECEKS